MLTERENLVEVMSGGKPERFANQYRAFKLLSHPLFTHRNNPKPGEVNKVNHWGVTMSWEEGLPGAFPVHKPDTIVMPDVEAWKDVVKAPPAKYADAEWEPFIEQAEAIDRKEYYVTPYMLPGVFEQTHYLGEITNILMAFYESPDDLKDLIKYLTEWELQVLEDIIDHLHPDALFHHDDWGSNTSTFLAPAMFDEFLVEPYKEIYGYAHDHGVELVIHHSDSYAATLVPEMIEMGINIWQGAVTNNDVPALVKQYGDRITIMGGLNSNELDKADWSQEEIFDAVESICAACGPRSFIPCLTQGLDSSTFDGVYDTAAECIDQFSEEYFD